MSFIFLWDKGTLPILWCSSSVRPMAFT